MNYFKIERFWIFSSHTYRCLGIDSARYSGAKPFKQINVRLRILWSMRCLIGSQWRSLNTGLIIIRLMCLWSLTLSLSVSAFLFLTGNNSSSSILDLQVLRPYQFYSAWRNICQQPLVVFHKSLFSTHRNSSSITCTGKEVEFFSG